jgi:hypothetical protein
MKNRIYLFLTVFVIELIIVIYNFDILSSVVPVWHSGKHYFGKFIFVTLVLLILIAFIITFLIELIKKIISKIKK